MTQNHFQGFPEEGIGFLKNLRENNNRDWFHANKSTYEQFVKVPAQLFFQEMTDRLAAVMQEPFTGKIFRINRDIRFSKDKTPYNCHTHISFFPNCNEGKTCGTKPAFHFGLEIDKIFLGTGSFNLPEDILNRYRQAVDDEPQGKKLKAILTAICKKDGFSLSKPDLKRVPNEYDKEHPRGDLLRHKSLLIWHEHKPNKDFFSPKAVDFIEDRFKEMKPVYDWLLTI